MAGSEQDPALVALRTESWLRTTDVPAIPPALVAWDLGHPGCEAILDDDQGRRCARALGIPLRGTVGVVLLAKRRGFIAVVRPVLLALRQAGLFITPALEEQALRLAGE